MLQMNNDYQFDNANIANYNKEELRRLIETTTKTAVAMAMKSVFQFSTPEKSYLDNGIAQAIDAPCLGGDNDMARIKSKIIIDGKECWITADSPQSLVDKALQISQQQQAAIPQECSDAPLFKDYALNWFELYCKPHVKSTTSSGVESYMRNHFIPAFGQMPIDCITVNDVQNFLNQRKDYAMRSLKDYRMWLRQILDAAVDDGYLAKNPARNKRISIPSHKATEREALTEDEFLDVLRQLNKLSEMDKLFIALAMFTGMRRGEILGLQYADIDREQGLIHVRRNVTYPKVNVPVIGTPKSKKGYRDIPILPQLDALLTERNDISFVFGESKPLSHTQVVNMVRRINKRINLHGATPHVLRHTFLTLASDSGIAPKIISAIGGHASTKFTMDRYVHAQIEPIKRAGEALAEKINSLGTQTEHENSPQSLVS